MSPSWFSLYNDLSLYNDVSFTFHVIPWIARFGAQNDGTDCVGRCGVLIIRLNLTEKTAKEKAMPAILAKHRQTPYSSIIIHRSHHKSINATSISKRNSRDTLHPAPPNHRGELHLTPRWNYGTPMTSRGNRWLRYVACRASRRSLGRCRGLLLLGRRGGSGRCCRLGWGWVLVLSITRWDWGRGGRGRR